ARATLKVRAKVVCITKHLWSETVGRLRRGRGACLAGTCPSDELLSARRRAKVKQQSGNPRTLRNTYAARFSGLARRAIRPALLGLVDRGNENPGGRFSVLLSRLEPPGTAW